MSKVNSHPKFSDSVASLQATIWVAFSEVNGVTYL